MLFYVLLRQKKENRVGIEGNRIASFELLQNYLKARYLALIASFSLFVQAHIGCGIKVELDKRMGEDGCREALAQGRAEGYKAQMKVAQKAYPARF